MHEKSDAQLLRDYAEHGQEAAFRELVSRYTDLVYSAALRQVESSDTAADIAQCIFVDLAQKARSVGEKLPAHRSLAGWLHRSTRFTAFNHLRDTRRRLTNERQAMEQLLTDSAASGDWEQIRPALDEALDGLDDEDREALLLRYFKNHNLRTVGLALGISDDTAQKRVSRAVERLREFFVKRGVTVGASGFAVAISANAVQAAPVGLALTVSVSALAGTAVTTSAIIATTTKTIAMTTLQKTLVTVSIATLAGVGIYEARQAAQLRSQVQTLQEEQASLAHQNQQLQLQQSEATNQSSSLAAELARAKTNNLELLRLRNEVGQLRKQTNLLAAQPTRATNSATTTSPSDDKSASELILQESYEFAGYATPPSTIKSLFWAATRADPQTVLASMAPALRAQTEAEWANKSEEELKSALQSDNNSVTGYRVTDNLVVSDNEVVLSIYLEGRNRTNKMRMIRVGDEWKVAGKPGQ